MELRNFLFLVIIFLVGCLDTQKDLGPEESKLIISLNTIIEKRCIYSSLNGLYFNTSSKTYDEEREVWIVNELPIISVSRSSYSDDILKKMLTLVDLGLFSIKERNFIYDNQEYQGRRSLYLVDSVDDNNDKVRRSHGVQFLLTEKGEKYILIKNEYGGLALCSGYHSVTQIGRPHKNYLFNPETEASLRRLHLSFNTEFILSDDFIEDKKLQQNFPSIKETLSRHRSGYGLFSVEKQEDTWEVEPKSIMF